MERTQIYLGAADIALLEQQADATGASRSELIRRAIQKAYGPSEENDVEARIARMHRAAGVWADRPFTGAEYTRAIRSGDMNANLRRIGAFD